MKFNSDLPVKSFDYCLDWVCVIDSTRAMEGDLDLVKRELIPTIAGIVDGYVANGHSVSCHRLKLITYKSFGDCDHAPLLQSRFFNLPEETAAAQQWLDDIQISDCQAVDGCGLEALATAMQSNWIDIGTRRRHMIMLFTNSAPSPLGSEAIRSDTRYPEKMPCALGELKRMWRGEGSEYGGMPDERYARILTYSPNLSPWSDLLDLNFLLAIYTDVDDDTIFLKNSIDNLWSLFTDMSV